MGTNPVQFFFVYFNFEKLILLIIFQVLLTISTLGARGFFSLGATELSGAAESRSGEKKTSGTNG